MNDSEQLHQNEWKVGSILQNENLNGSLSFSSDVEGREGEVVAVKVKTDTTLSGELETESGRIAPVHKGDVVVGVLGKRKALEGVVGTIPNDLEPGDTLHLLNLGGVIGRAQSWNRKTTTRPVEVQLLGSVRNGTGALNIRKSEDRSEDTIDTSASILLISGTSMNTGKTSLATELVELLSQEHDLNVAGAKLTGVATQRDMNAMEEAGAEETGSFADLGFTSTIDEDREELTSAAKTVLNRLGNDSTDVIVAELGDGIVGWYGVDTFISDEEFVNAIDLHMVCANDLAGALGSVHVCEEHDMSVDFISGPVTNTSAGVDYITSELNLRAGSSEHVKESLEALLKDEDII